VLNIIKILPLIFLLTSCYGWKTKVDNSSSEIHDSSMDLEEDADFVDEEVDAENCQQCISDEEYSEAEINSSPIHGQISVGGNVVNAIIDGKIYFWGKWKNSTYYSNPEFSAAPIEIDFKDMVIDEKPVAVFSGDMHGCGLFSGGRLFCWGNNDYGQLGNTTASSSLKPREVNMTGDLKGRLIYWVACGKSHTCMIAGDGFDMDVYCWGSSIYGKLGLTNPAEIVYTPNKVISDILDQKNIIRIDAGKQFTCAVDDEGKLYCWGNLNLGEYRENRNEPFLIGKEWGLDKRNIISVVCGDEHICVLDSRHRIFCLGNSNTHNILGIESNSISIHFSEVVIRDNSGNFLETEKLIAGDFFTCAIDKNDMTYCWGKNEDCCFREDGITSNLPVSVKGTVDSIKDGYVSAGLQSFCIKDKDSSDIFCRGTNSDFKLGNGTTVSSSCDFQKTALDSSIKDKEITHVVTRNYVSCAVGNSNLQCWGKAGGTDNYDEKNFSYLVPYQLISEQDMGERKIVKVARGNEHSCYLDDKGDVFCWGNNLKGQLGYGTNDDSYVMDIAVKGGDLGEKKVVDISLGNSFSCALDSEGSVYCWGYNSKGQLGTGDLKNSSVPEKVDMSGALNGKKVEHIAAGVEHVCVIADDKSVYCWGNNGCGQLGNNSFEDSAVPVKVDDTGVIKDKKIEHIDTLFDHNCVIDSEGFVYCWGRNEYGELGNGEKENSSVPVRATIGKNPDEIKSVVVSTGYSHTCAVDNNGDLYCWGYRNYSVVDTDVYDEYYNIKMTMDVGDASRYPIVEIDAGIGYTCMVNNIGQVYCWGENHFGQLGNATDSNSDLPVRVY